MTLLLTRGDVAALLALDECIAAVEQAFARQAEGKAPGPGVLALHTAGGGFHVKAAGLPLGRFYAAAKVNPDDIDIFDSTGVAIEDVAAAVMVYEKAIGAARGIAVELGT